MSKINAAPPTLVRKQLQGSSWLDLSNTIPEHVSRIELWAEDNTIQIQVKRSTGDTHTYWAGSSILYENINWIGTVDLSVKGTDDETSYINIEYYA